MGSVSLPPVVARAPRLLLQSLGGLLKPAASKARTRGAGPSRRRAGRAGISHETHYRWLRESEGYEAAFHSAREEAADHMEGLALERAMNRDLPGQCC